MAAGAVPIDISGDLSSQASSSAQGGRIGGSWINNSSGGHIGLVKMLAIAGIAALLYKIYRGR